MVPRRRRADPSASALGAALASDPHTAGADPAGLAWFAVCCTLVYLIIIWRLCRPVQRPGVAVVSGIGGGGACDGMPSSVAQVVYRRLAYLLRRVRWNRANQRKRPCKAL